MTLPNILATLITLAAVFSYLNHRFIRLPTTIGLMLIALVLSLGLIALNAMGIDFETPAEQALARIDFSQTLLQGMLSFLLFAGALHVDLGELARQKWTIATFATVGVLVSTVLVAVLMYGVLALVGSPLPFLWCLAFGALISPTDPIAVLALLKQAGAPQSLETKITGESLFNDGVGVVVFLVILELIAGGREFSLAHAAELLVVETGGGIVLGLALGWIAFRMLRSIDQYTVEVLITLALVAGGYALATALHTSGPLAIVAAGLLIGNHGRVLAMSEHTRERLDTFWELVDEILNAVLFVLIGFEILILTLEGRYVLAGLLAIPIVLLARAVSVGIPVALFRRFREFTPHVVKILTWGGLRGGISVALALSLPAGPERDLILTVTYVVVVFSILVQGLSLAPLLRRAVAATPPNGPD